MPRILLIEDEDSIRHLISYDLKNAGFDVTGCPDGASAREKGLNESFDIMIIDWMLPEISGIELVRLFRGKGIDSVMMMLTAKDEEEDILEAFEAGVDDYITTPFSPRELLARIQAHVKRIVKTSRRVLEMGGLTMDLGSREVSVNGQPVSLSCWNICCAIRRSSYPATTFSTKSGILITMEIPGSLTSTFSSCAISCRAAV